MPKLNLELLDAQFCGGLVVSCQPVETGPMDHTDTVVRLALAALAGGARAVRIERAARVAAVRAATAAPIIGIVKHDLTDSPVRITPFIEDIAALAEAGASIIAVDATTRARPVAVIDLLLNIHALGVFAMADCASLAEITAAHGLGFDIVGTTLSGYTGGTVPSEPDYALLAQAAKLAPRVMAEGRFNTPLQVSNAIASGAWAVTVGTAITRTEVVTAWFSRALTKD